MYDTFGNRIKKESREHQTSGGIDLVTQERIADMLDEEIEGIQLQVGAGIGIDVHLMQSHTNTIYSTHIRWLDKLFEFLGVQEKNKTDVCSEE